MPGAFPPASHGTCGRLQKVTERGLFPEASLFQHYMVLRETSKLERLWRDCGVFMPFSLICDNPLPWALGEQRTDLPCGRPVALRRREGAAALAGQALSSPVCRLPRWGLVVLLSNSVARFKRWVILG